MGLAGVVAYAQTDTCVFHTGRQTKHRTDRQAGRQAGKELPVCLTGGQRGKWKGMQANGHQPCLKQYQCYVQQLPTTSGMLSNPIQDSYLP